jgi:site-specific DNA recombinase
MINAYDALHRVSSMGIRDEDADTTRTLDDQTRATGGEAKRRGGRVAKTFKELDQSGSDVLAKIGDELVARVREGKSRGVIFAYSDRLCRNATQGLAFLEAMRQAGGEVIDATMPNIDYRTDEGRLLFAMKMVINEMPSLQAKTRSKRIADQHVRDGIPNRVSYGYRRNGEIGVGGVIVKTLPDRDEKVLVPDEQTAPVVQRIFAMRDDNRAWAAMCDALDADGIPSPKGGTWTPGTLSSIIRNDAYLGIVKLGERRNETAHEALVSRALWQRVQATHSVVRNGNLVAGIAGALLRCETCGQPMSVIGSSTSRPNYGCRRRSSDGKCPRPVHVTKAIADAYVERLIVELLDSGDGIDFVVSARDIEEARLAWERAAESRSRFADFADTLDADDFRKGYAKRQDIEQTAHELYDELVARAGDAHEHFPADSTAWRLLDEEHQRRVARQLIERVTVSVPFTRSKYANVEDRFEVVLVGGAKMRQGLWLVPAA